MFKKLRKKIGIIGTGNIGSAIARRIKSKYRIFVFDKDKEKVKKLKGVCLSENNIDLAKNSDVIILAVKPQDFEGVVKEIKEQVKEKLIVSVAAAITTSYLEKILGEVRIIRVMPNMPAIIGKGVSCLCKGRFATDKDLGFTWHLFKKLGIVFVFDEEMMNAVTAVSGSGPGFLFDLIENKPKDEWRRFAREVFIPEFTTAAESLGFSKKEAELLVKATTSRSLVTVETTKASPLQLKLQVASKGGTTEAGLEALHTKGSLTEAVKAAVKRADELCRKE